MKKIKMLFITILIGILIPSFAQAETYVTELVVGPGNSATWTLAGSPYIATGTLQILGTLTIEPGVVVRFGTGSGMSIQDNGILIAEGTPIAPITFTSHQDTPTKGHWQGIAFSSSKISRLTYCQIEYGGRNRPGNIYCHNYFSLPLIATSTIANSSSNGIYAGNPTIPTIFHIYNCMIRDNERYPVSTDPMIDMENNTFINNGGGDPLRNVIRIFGGSYGGISQDITWHNPGIPYLISNGKLLIGDQYGAGTLTIDAGVTIKVDTNNSIIIGYENSLNNGCLQANGREASEIIFTSNQANPNHGDWGYIKFDAYSQNSFLKYCKIEYAGNDNINIGTQGAQPAVQCVKSAPEISYVDISKVYSDGICCGEASSPTINYSTIVAGTCSYGGKEASAIYSQNASPIIGSSTVMKSKYGLYCDNNTGQFFVYPTIVNSNIIGNTIGVHNADTDLEGKRGSVTAKHNWWGTSTGPYNDQNNPTGGGDRVSNYVDFYPWLGIDTVPPGQITLEFKDNSVEVATITLRWQPTGDDFLIGTPIYYVINYATYTITKENWGTKTVGSITLKVEDITPDNTRYYSYDVGPLIPRTTYFFGIKAVDEAGNWSPLSDCIGTTTKATFDPPIIYRNNVVNGNGKVTLIIQNGDTSNEIGLWIYYGSQTGVSWEKYDGVIDAGTVATSGSTDTTISDLTNGQLYYFVAYAYDPASKTDKTKWSLASNVVIGSPTILTYATITGSLKVIVNTTGTYLAKGLGSFGEPLDQILRYTWSITPENLGLLTPVVGTETGVNGTSTIFTAGTKAMTGSLTVVITDGTETVSNTITITLLAGSATTLKINTPQGAIITAGGILTFTSEGYDNWNNQVDGSNFFWQIEPNLWIITPTSGATTTLTGTKATSGTLTLAADGTQTSIRVTILPTSTTKFIFAEIPSPQKLAIPFDIALYSVDKYDNYSQDDKISGSVSLTITSLPPKGTTLATMTVVSGFGTKSISITLLGTYTILARGTFTDSIILEGISNLFRIESGTPTQFIFSLPSGTISLPPAGTTTITAYLADSSGIRIDTAGVECSLSIQPETVNATGTLGTLTTWTDDKGEISTLCQVGTTSDSQIKVIITTLAFGGFTGTSPLIITRGGQIARFEFDEIGTQTAGVSFWGTITAKDSYGNRTDFVGTTTLSLPNGTITPTETTAFGTNGVWIGTMTITTAMSNVVIMATHSSGAYGTSNPFKVTSGPLYHINISPTYTTTPIEGTISFTCQGKDEYGNDIEGVIYTWESMFGTFTPSQGTSTIFTAGTLAGIGTISVTSGLITAIGTIEILPGTLAFLSIFPSPATITAGATLTLTAQGKDEYGNDIEGVIYTWESMFGTFTPSQGTSTIFTAGTLAGIGTISVTSGLITAIGTIEILPGTLAFLSIFPSPATITAGATLTLTAVGYDAYWNELAAITCSWEVNIGTITYELPGTTAYLYATRTGIWVATTTANGIITSTIAITVNPSHLHHFGFTNVPFTKIAGEKFTFQVYPQDIFENQAEYEGSITLGTLYKGSIVYWNGTFLMAQCISPGPTGTLFAVGTYNIIAKDYPNGTIRGTSNTFSITPATDTARLNIYVGTTSVPISGTTAVTI